MVAALPLLANRWLCRCGTVLTANGVAVFLQPGEKIFKWDTLS